MNALPATTAPSLPGAEHGEAELAEDSFEAAVMAGDGAVAEWLHGPAAPDEGEPAVAMLDDDESSDREDAPWLPALTGEDRTLVREYMLASRYPPTAVDSLDDWPVSELRHLLDHARSWKARQAQRAIERAETDRQLHELEERRMQSRAVVERIYRDQAAALVARDCDKSIILLTAREARRSRTGNHVQGNPGLELERHLREVAAERGFATGPPRWDRAGNRLVIDLYHRGAEAWWNSGEAGGLVPVPPNGTALVSKRAYRALYPFQRAAINAAFLNRQTNAPTMPRDSTLPAPETRSSGLAADPPSAGAGVLTTEPLTHSLLKETASLPQPQAPPDALSTAPSPPPAPTLSGPSEAAAGSSTAKPPAPAQTKPTTIPNARKGFKLTLWVSPVTEAGLADVHGLLQLDGADPVPFCSLKDVPNPLARALQEAYVAVERVRARPPRMAPPAAAAPPTATPSAAPSLRYVQLPGPVARRRREPRRLSTSLHRNRSPQLRSRPCSKTQEVPHARPRPCP